MTEDRKGALVGHAVRIVLLLGVCASALAMSIGVILSLSTGRHAAAGVPLEWASSFARAIRGDAVSMSYLGLIVLVFTPIARVVVLGIGWSLEKDYWFASVALVVFGLLLGSLFLGVV